MTATLRAEDWLLQEASTLSGKGQIDGQAWGSSPVPWGVFCYEGYGGSSGTFNIYLRAFNRQTLQLGAPIVISTGAFFSFPYVRFNGASQNMGPLGLDTFFLGLRTYGGSPQNSMVAYQVHADLSITQIAYADMPGDTVIIGACAYPGSTSKALVVYKNGTAAYTGYAVFDTAASTVTDIGFSSKYVVRLLDAGDGVHLLAESSNGDHAVAGITPTPTSVTEGTWVDVGAQLASSLLSESVLAQTSSGVGVYFALTGGPDAANWPGFARVTISGTAVTLSQAYTATGLGSGGWSFNGDVSAGGSFGSASGGAIAVFGWNNSALMLFTTPDGVTWTQEDLNAAPLSWWTNSYENTVMGAVPGATDNEIVIAVQTADATFAGTAAMPIGSLKIGIISTIPQPDLAATRGSARVHFS